MGRPRSRHRVGGDVVPARPRRPRRQGPSAHPPYQASHRQRELGAREGAHLRVCHAELSCDLLQGGRGPPDQRGGGRRGGGLLDAGPHDHGDQLAGRVPLGEVGRQRQPAAFPGRRHLHAHAAALQDGDDAAAAGAHRGRPHRAHGALRHRHRRHRGHAHPEADGAPLRVQGRQHALLAHLAGRVAGERVPEDEPGGAVAPRPARQDRAQHPAGGGRAEAEGGGAGRGVRALQAGVCERRTAGGGAGVGGGAVLPAGRRLGGQPRRRHLRRGLPAVRRRRAAAARGARRARHRVLRIPRLPQPAQLPARRAEHRHLGDRGVPQPQLQRRQAARVLLPPDGDPTGIRPAHGGLLPVRSNAPGAAE
mmetsp:Transcript_31800/g.81458  ORF Transcript_31800/g.81458 Transcript_31800/m.81458 type:complete len:364 (-) Transcript_31800:133-1224(-)